MQSQKITVAFPELGYYGAKAPTWLDRWYLAIQLPISFIEPQLPINEILEIRSVPCVMKRLKQYRAKSWFVRHCFGSGTAHNCGPLCTDQAANNEKHKIKYAEILSNLKLLDIIYCDSILVKANAHTKQPDGNWDGL